MRAEVAALMHAKPYHRVSEFDEADGRHPYGPSPRFERLPFDLLGERRTVLCLSGGGYRGAAYHLGALRRLHELRLLRHIDEIRTVSGGSLLAAWLAVAIQRRNGRVEDLDWDTDVALPFRKLLRHDRRTVPILVTLPFNWAVRNVRVRLLARSLDRAFDGALVQNLPHRPQIKMLATDLLRGELIVIPDFVGATWTVGLAAAVSAAFPPLFGPFLTQATIEGIERRAALADGGVWGNLGVSGRILTTSELVLVSDASYPLVVDHGRPSKLRLWLPRALRVAVQRGDAALRYQMWLSDSPRQRFEVWRISQTTWRAQDDAPAFEYSVDATNLISRIRTDLDAFTDDEIAILENHGYLRAASSLSWLIERERRDVADCGRASAGISALRELVHASELPMVSPPHPDSLLEHRCVTSLAGSNRRMFKFRKLRKLHGYVRPDIRGIGGA